MSDPLDDLLEQLLEERKLQGDEPPEEVQLSTRLERAERAEEQEGQGEFLTPIEQRAELKKRVRDLKQLLAVFLKAGKTLRLYSEQHRFFDRFAQEFMTRLEEQFEAFDALTFEITPVSINWDGSNVFENRDQRENLAFKLYRDGVRLLQFRRGLTIEEVREFVTLVAREVDAGGVAAKDLSVLFWEADFKHIHIAVAETFVEFSAEAARVLSEIQQNLEELQAAFELDPAVRAQARHEPEAYSGKSKPESVEDELRSLMEDDPWAMPFEDDGDDEDEPESETEVPEVPEEVQDEVKLRQVYEDLMGLEDPYATFEEVGSVLGEVVAQETDESELRLLLAHLDDALSPLLATAAIGPLNAVLRRLGLLGRIGFEKQDFSGDAIRDFFVRFCQSDRLSLLARAIDDDWSDAWKGDLFTFVSLQSRSGVQELIGFLGQVRGLGPRRVITDGLILLADRRPEPFLEALKSTNWRLAADAVYALSRIGDPTSLDEICGAFARDEHTLRVEILQALRNYQSPRIQDLMLDALEDPHEAVRLAALRYLAVYRIREAVPLMTRTMGSREFGDRTFDEKRGWYISLGHVAGEAVFTAFRKRVEPVRGREKATEEAHLGLLGIRSIRGPAAGKFLEEFSGAVFGDLRLLVRKLIRERKGG